MAIHEPVRVTDVAVAFYADEVAYASNKWEHVMFVLLSHGELVHQQCKEEYAMDLIQELKSAIPGLSVHAVSKRTANWWIASRSRSRQPGCTARPWERADESAGIFSFDFFVQFGQNSCIGLKSVIIEADYTDAFWSFMRIS